MSAYFVSARGLAGRVLPKGALSPLAQELFGAYEPGGMYDPEITGTLFQDSAGTAPVTAVEQPVGLMLDLSGRGNHATQSTTTKRPVLSRRVNLFDATLPTGLRNGTGALIPNAFGGVSGYQLTRTSGSDEVFVPIPPTALFPGASYTLDVYLAVGASDKTAATFSLYTSAGITAFSINYSTGGFSAGVSTNGFSCSLVSSESVAGGWRTRIKFTIPTSASAITLARMYMWAGAGTGSPGMIVGNPQFTLATDAHLPYQWVNTATDYDADPGKFPAYLRFDGVDDAMQTGNINFTGTDKMTVWAGVNESSPAQALIVELTTFGLNAGAFSLYTLSGSCFAFASIGPSPNNAVTAVVPESTNHVLTGYSDVAGGVVGARLNGVPNTIALTGSGSHANAPLYIGSRSAASNYLNGRLYSLIVRGAQTPLSQIEATELYIKQKMRLP